MKPTLLATTARFLIAGAALTGAASGTSFAADTQVPAAVPFAAFVAALDSTPGADIMARPEARVASAANLEEMRTHLRKLYDGIDVSESYALGGQTFDCVRYDQQPAVRLQGLTSIASPPPFSPDAAFHTAAGRPGRNLKPATFESVSCHAGTFPLPRVTLEEVSQFASLRDFFAKGPGDLGQAPAPRGVVPPAVATHKYSYAQQYVTNYGSYASESVYDPYVNTSLGEIFSLQQQWTVGFGTAGTQTAEIGWQVYPGLYGTSAPVLFAYYTADGYNHTGCYNYSCGAFVQYSGSTIHLQTTLSPVSVVGGAQYYISDGYYYTGGNWWLAVQGQWVGYYPGSLYSPGGNGGLRTASTLWEVGTEGVGTTIWPPEGSGQFASRGYPYASWWRNLLWRDSGNGGHYPSLTSETPSPKCYTITNQAYGGSTWGYYLYLGGPGGTAC